MSSAVHPRRYLDNAATSFPKPPGVMEAMRDYTQNLGASPGRGTYREAICAGRILEQCRNAVRELFAGRPDHQVIFTLNGTDALNIAIKGLVRPGDHVVTTCMDHNSVLRPLSALHARDRVEWTVVPADPVTTRIDPADVARAIRTNTALVAINHASNVTGVLQPIEAIADLCRQRRLPLLVDAAQSAGHVPINLSRIPIDLLACPGHKGLLGPLGTGVLVVQDRIAAQMHTLREGGTGSAGEQVTQPEFLPDKFEPGSHNAVGIAGLLASLRWLLSHTVQRAREHELELSRQMIQALDRCPALRWFGPRDVEERVGVFSVRLAGLDPAELSAVLEDRYGILTRSGLHCAPYAHRTIGTAHDGGATRLSFSVFTTHDDVAAAAEALSEIASLRPPGL